MIEDALKKIGQKADQALTLATKALQSSHYVSLRPVDPRGYIQDLLTSQGFVELDGPLVEINGQINQPAGTVLTAKVPGVTRLKLATTAISKSVITQTGDDCTVSNLILNGNLNAREAAGGTFDYVFAVHMQDASGNLIERCTWEDCGDTDDDFLNGGNGGGVLMEITTAATADVTRNRILNCGGNLPKAGFHARILSPFVGVGPGVYTVFATANIIDGLWGIAGRKNAIELCGPYTHGNLVKNCLMTDVKGQGGIEADFGGNNNRFVDNRLYFSPTYLLERSLDCFSSRRSNPTDGARSYGNTFVDCSVIFHGTRTSTFGLNGFVEAGESSDAQFIRPKIFCNHENAAFDKQVGATGVVTGYQQQATIAKNHNTYIEAPVFYNVDRGVKVVSTSGADLIALSDGHIYSRGAWYECSTGVVVDQMLFTGSLYLQSRAVSGTTGSGTTTLLTYDANVRQQTSATDPIA